MPITTILSPHTDDAVLSLWGVLTGPGEVKVINIFDGVPEGQRALGWWDRLTRAEDPVARAEERRAEDRAALALAGRSALSLGFVDEQYRDGDESELGSLVERIARELAQGSVVLAPAALGEHPDHRRTRTAAMALCKRGFRVALYADVPHAAPHGWPAWVTGVSRESDSAARDWERSLQDAGFSLGELASKVRALDSAEQAHKREAIDCYRTQLSGLEATFSLLSRPEILRYEVIWRLPNGVRSRPAATI